MPVQVFYSYSHKDEELRVELEKHLSNLRRGGVISQWHDRQIVAGDDWSTCIDDHVNTSDVILLLVSPDFMASDYCHEFEMKIAMERHLAGEAHVIPVILRATDWKGAPFDKLQAVPTDGKPVTSWPNIDEAFKNVADGIRKAVEKLGQATQTDSGLRRIQFPGQRRNRTLEGAAPPWIPVGHSRFVVAKVSLEGSRGLRETLASDDTYAIDSTNVKAQEFSMVFPKFKGETLPVNALVRLKSPDCDPKQQELYVELSAESDSILLPFQVKAEQSGPKFLTFELLIQISL